MCHCKEAPPSVIARSVVSRSPERSEGDEAIPLIPLNPPLEKGDCHSFPPLERGGRHSFPPLEKGGLPFFPPFRKGGLRGI